jgi:aryl-alcohol dehydrogenase-like predicted oxidoreductase
VALAWLLQRRGVTSPIVGATKVAHLEDAVAAVSVKLAKEEVRALEAAYVPHPVAGFS